MPLPTPENKISWNGVLPIFAAILAAGISYGMIQRDVSDLRENSVPASQVSALEAEIRAITAQQASNVARVQALQEEVHRNNVATARMQEQLGAVLATTARIERSLDRLVETSSSQTRSNP